MPTNWNTRLTVVCTIDGEDVVITPLQSFTPTFALNAQPLHSIEQSHLGVVYTPAALTFTMTVNAIGDAVAKLTSIALRGQPFKIMMQEKGDGHDWSFTQLVMDGCVITSAAPSAATVTGAPTATFSGFSLEAAATPKGAPVTRVPVR
jgi:hypothetical protein